MDRAENGFWEGLLARGSVGERADLAGCGGVSRAGNRPLNPVAPDSARPLTSEREEISKHLTYSELSRDRWSYTRGPVRPPWWAKNENGFGRRVYCCSRLNMAVSTKDLARKGFSRKLRCQAGFRRADRED